MERWILDLARTYNRMSNGDLVTYSRSVAAVIRCWRSSFSCVRAMYRCRLRDFGGVSCACIPSPRTALIQEARATHRHDNEQNGASDTLACGCACGYVVSRTPHSSGVSSSSSSNSDTGPCHAQNCRGAEQWSRFVAADGLQHLVRATLPRLLTVWLIRNSFPAPCVTAAAWGITATPLACRTVQGCCSSLRRFTPHTARVPCNAPPTPHNTLEFVPPHSQVRRWDGHQPDYIPPVCSGPHRPGVRSTTGSVAIDGLGL